MMNAKDGRRVAEHLTSADLALNAAKAALAEAVHALSLVAQEVEPRHHRPVQASVDALTEDVNDLAEMKYDIAHAISLVSHLAKE